MGEGVEPERMALLTDIDRGAPVRQVGLVDAKGRSATYRREVPGVVASWENSPPGNILTGEDVVKNMARSFQESKGDLGERLIAALAVGQRRGDSRGMQSAALLIVRDGWATAASTTATRPARRRPCGTHHGAEACTTCTEDFHVLISRKWHKHTGRFGANGPKSHCAIYESNYGSATSIV
jgi:hypothetical protein